MRPILRSPVVKKTLDKGTDNEQTITLPHQTTYLEIFLGKVGWWLSEHSPTEEPAASRNGRFRGSGFYMSIPQAKRIYWIWRGEAKWSLFWAPRAKGEQLFELWRYK